MVNNIDNTGSNPNLHKADINSPQAGQAAYVSSNADNAIYNAVNWNSASSVGQNIVEQQLTQTSQQQNADYQAQMNIILNSKSSSSQTSSNRNIRNVNNMI